MTKRRTKKTKCVFQPDNLALSVIDLMKEIQRGMGVDMTAGLCVMNRVDEDSSSHLCLTRGPCQHSSLAEDVYQALSRHQVTESWEFRDLFAELERWVLIFDSEFKLQIPRFSRYSSFIPTVPSWHISVIYCHL